MIQTVASFVISIVIISTLIEILITFVSSLFKYSDDNIVECDVNRKSFGYYIDPIWFESTQTIISPILFRRNYYSQNLKTLRRYKYKHKYNKLW